MFIEQFAFADAALMIVLDLSSSWSKHWIVIYEFFSFLYCVALRNVCYIWSVGSMIFTSTSSQGHKKSFWSFQI
jgi:hypothetical protein